MQPIPSMTVMLIDGASQHETVISHSPFTIGRSTGKDITLPYPYISRNHAEIVYEDGRFHLVDSGSRSGCFVNGKRVARHALAPSDVIHLGSVEGPHLRFGTPDSTTIRDLLHHIQHPSGPDSDIGKLSWFLEAARKMNGVGAVHEILVSLIETTIQLTQVERGYVFLKDAAGQLTLAAGRSNSHESLEDASTLSHTAIQQAIQGATEFIVTDTLSAEAGSPSESMVAQSIRTVICIPLRKRSSDYSQQEREILGVLYLDSRLQRGSLTSIDSDLLKTIATEAAVLVENASLVQAEEAARRYREELSIAAGIQQGLMTVRIPELPYASVQAHSIACKDVGGDFYDVLSMESGLYIVVADISGKGISAALLGSTLQGLVHSQILAGQPLANIAMFANRYICGRDIQKYATLILAKLTPDGWVEYLNCGHVQPLHQHLDGVTSLGNGNLPVGLLEDAVYVSETIRIKPGERILIVTDGVTEAEDPTGEFYGDERLEASILSGSSIGALFEQIQAFMCGSPANDDCTILEVCYGQGAS